MQVSQLFEEELQRRGIPFQLDPESGCHQIRYGDITYEISLSNLEKQIERDGDPEDVIRFVEAILNPGTEAASAEDLFLMLEPSDYATPPDFRKHVSDRLDVALVQILNPSGNIRWVQQKTLEKLNLSREEAESLAIGNLDRELQNVVPEFREIDGVRLGFLNTSFPSKGSLVLAPGFRELIEPHLGWPLLAVLPSRDFLYLWNAEHQSFISRLGGVVVREFTESPWPLSPEVFRIDDRGIEAIGSFPLPD